MTAKGKSGTKLISEGRSLYPIFLTVVGLAVTSAAFMESYFQLTGSPFTLLGLAHDYGWLKEYEVSKLPQRGIWHPIGWVGTVCFFVMMLYSVRKRAGFLKDVGPMRYWLDTHMFLGIVGTLLITVHCTYKVGGIVSLSFWSMVLVASSGFIGRYIYIQIPRNISGTELRMDEIDSIMDDINEEMARYAGKDTKLLHYFEAISGPKDAGQMGIVKTLFVLVANDLTNFGRMFRIRAELARNKNLPPHVKKRFFKLVREKGGLLRSKGFLDTSHRLLHYWHVFHKPFAVIMFVIMFLHIAVVLVFESAK